MGIHYTYVCTYMSHNIIAFTTMHYVYTVFVHVYICMGIHYTISVDVCLDMCVHNGTSI
jgi:hypothetical protein